MKRILIPIFYLFSATAIYANYPIVRNFDKNEYRSGTQNWAISQDTSGGCVYFANNNGLVEFDGTNWATYPIRNYTNVRSVYADHESGKIYAGGFNEFGYYCLSENGEIVYHTEMDKMDKEGGTEEIWNILPLGETLYIQSNKEVFKFDGTTFTQYEINDKIECSAIIRNTVLISTREHGILALGGDTFVQLPGTDILKGKKVCSLLSYGTECFLIVTEYDGIYRYENNSMKRVDMPEDISCYQIFCAALNNEAIALGTVGNGVFIIENGKVVHLNKRTGLQNNTVLSMNFDDRGNLWLGLDKGIDYVILNSPERSLFGSDNICGAGYASAMFGGRMYLGTNQGLYYIDDFLDMHDEDAVNAIDGIGGQVWSLCEIYGTLFCGSDNGLYIIDGTMAERVEGISGTWKVMKMRSRKDMLIGCSYDGLFTMKMTDGKWSTPKKVKGFGESSGRFEEDSEGCIYLYHWMKGTFRLTLDKECSEVTDIMYCAQNIGLPGEKNNIPNLYRGDVVLSSDRGFFRYDPARGKAIPVDELNSLFSSPARGLNIVTSPCSDDLIFTSGDLNAIAYRDKSGKMQIDSLSLKFLGKKQILGFEDICFLDENEIIINTEDGFSRIDIGKLKNGYGGKRADVFIKGISSISKGKEVLPVFGARSPEYGLDRELKLPYSQNSLRFDFVCPQYEDRNAILYSYRLDKFDSQWSEYSPESYKDYTKLPFGKYTFHVKSINILHQVESETSVNFTISPPWYASIPAFATYLLLISIIGSILLKFADKVSERKARNVEMEKGAEIERLKAKTLENDLRHKSQDLASSTMNLIRKNEILLDINANINKTLDYINEDDKAKGTKLLNKIQRDIRENIEHDDYWQKFEQNFDIVYEDYLKRLGEKYPSISLGDKRLCAYLKMGMSSKDIAMLLNMSVHSVEMARYRLRKKMELSREVNLVDYLQHF